MTEETITKNMTIGEVLEKFPATEAVFMKHFGNGCFTCPGAKTEDIAFGATMHGLDAESIINDLNEAIAAS
jgi:hybrid cluster-associated redox disulfide protein